MSSKYGNKKVKYDGKIFDSMREARRYMELKLLVAAGEITDLQCQVPFELIPTQREEPCEVYKRGARRGEPKEGKVVEKAVVYVADFCYFDTKTNNYIVEDCKGCKTKEYILKRKMMLFLRGIRILET